ncbi:NACHT domain-containing NTPase [Nostoc sp. DSM 114161]|jgi:predicted NACHT family NTPase|uniref:NACHT C-terminal helical domain 2-containing protein n=1 Tax=Nostoc sp. DSM 114161 TaxID=3440143 RepID=UPI004046225B
MTRSLKASKTGLEKAQRAFKLKGWTQEYLAGAAGCSRPVVIKFFAGRLVDKQIFQAICTELGLEWGEIAELEEDEKQAVKTPSVDELVQQVRQKVSAFIQKQCGFMRVLDMTHPIELKDIYTDVNILEKITGRRRLKIAELLENCNLEDFDRLGLSRVAEKRVSGLEAVERYSKLMILGKPGAGKTTFLKRIAILCNSRQFLPDRVPIFITLKEFAEEPQQPSLLQYINDNFALSDISDQEITKTVLHQGRAIVLLDGLDEVRQADNHRILREIRNFSTDYDANYFVMTCRIASKEYTFEQFTEVEVADFNEKQITEFATKWFQTKDLKKAEQFIQKLQENQQIKELATNPLLLTLLCLLFGESTDFPSNRSELYQEGVDVLLKKWDGTRHIERDEVYHKLSLKRKQDLLSKIALETFEGGNYFFKERLVEEYISNYIQNLPDAQTDQQALLLDSNAVLKSIEAQHGLLVERARGIYSFSHLTFHEFFAARKITLNRNPQQVFQQLASHITDKHWREVFLLTVGILDNADDLSHSMKQEIDQLLATDKKIQKFLTWIEEKSRCVDSFYKSAAVRAFYFDLDLDLGRNLVRDLDRALDPALDRELALDSPLNRTLALYQDRDLECALALALYHDRDFRFYRTREDEADFDHSRVLAIKNTLTHTRIRDRELEEKLQELAQQLPDKESQQWWQEKGLAWTQKLRTVMIEYRNIGHDWQFSKEQKELLQQYYDANQLLVDCLNSECYVSRDVRQQIEDTLLRPIPFN